MVVRRYAPVASRAAPVVELAQKWESPETINRGLREAVRRKLGKRYQLNHGETLILLLYERFWFPRVYDGAIELAQKALSGSEHSFDEVWYFYPAAEDPEAPNKPEGFLWQVWPANES